MPMQMATEKGKLNVTDEVIAVLAGHFKVLARSPVRTPVIDHELTFTAETGSGFLPAI